MGNYVSCTLSSPVNRQSSGAKVIFPGGEIRLFDRPTNAAELMLETPNHFLVNSLSLHIGRRFSALSADEELEMGNVYVLFPMRRVNSLVTAADFGALFMTANSAVRRASREQAGFLAGLERDAHGPPMEAKIQAENVVARLNLDEIEDDTVKEFKARMSMCRSRRPLLETIYEETFSSR